MIGSAAQDVLRDLADDIREIKRQLAPLVLAERPASFTQGYPAISGLTTGQPIRATGAAAAAFGALDLENTNAVTGALPHGKGGTGLSATPSNGQLPIGNGSGYALAGLTGTANQITVTNGAGTITLSTPQNLHTGASPTFGALTLSSTLTVGTADSTHGLTTINSHNSTGNAYLDTLILNRYTSGTPAANLGGLLKTQIKSSTSLRIAFQLGWRWVDATDATRKSQAVFYIEDTATREAFRIEASGSAPMIGFLGANAAARPPAYTQTYATATRTHANITAADPGTYAGGAFGYNSAAQAQALYNAVEALIVDMANVKQVLNQVIDDVQLYGLFA